MVHFSRDVASIPAPSPRRLPWEQAAALTIHEWGTFTSLQSERGAAVPGINVDDEPVPEFVHRLASGLLLDARSPPRQKGRPRAHSQVTMRLETPVVYFHLPRGWSEPVGPPRLSTVS